MQITVYLNALENHQDYLRQELRASERLLAILKEQQQMNPDKTAFFQCHIQTIQDFREVARQRSKVLLDTYDLFKGSGHFLSEKLNRADQMIRR